MSAKQDAIVAKVDALWPFLSAKQEKHLENWGVYFQIPKSLDVLPNGETPYDPDLSRQTEGATLDLNDFWREAKLNRAVGRDEDPTVEHGKPQSETAGLTGFLTLIQCHVSEGPDGHSWRLLLEYNGPDGHWQYSREKDAVSGTWIEVV